MPLVVPEDTSGPQPLFSTRVFQLLDSGALPWDAVFTALRETISQLIDWLGSQAVIAIEEISA